MGKSGYMRKSSILKMRFFWGVFGIYGRIIERVLLTIEASFHLECRS